MISPHILTVHSTDSPLLSVKKKKSEVIIVPNVKFNCLSGHSSFCSRLINFGLISPSKRVCSQQNSLSDCLYTIVRRVAHIILL